MAIKLDKFLKTERKISEDKIQKVYSKKYIAPEETKDKEYNYALGYRDAIKAVQAEIIRQRMSSGYND